MLNPPFGRVLTAMVTPFHDDGSVNLDEARRLAAYLVDEQRNDALVINGTTGESPTTTDEEKFELLKAVVAEVGDRAKVVAGVGTNETAATIKRSREAADAGAHGLLVVTPYYSKPPQDAVAEHFTIVADSTDLPVMLYDIPGRTGIPIDPRTLVEVASHERIVAVKDAKGALASSAEVMAETDLAYYAGDDAMTLPLLSVGGVGVVGTSTHFTGARTKLMIDAFLAGDLDGALQEYRRLLPVYNGVFATQGCMLVKAALGARGFRPGPLRRPLKAASDGQRDAFVALLDAAGL
ncbi:4-hydroxy-tetrahydrodipicolinate synthase [Nigerium massiliense]|uniref:4-hydroxy-tetrahydrodipicolinate synthase n=1 Tax=Nigerium massiliense TaxID=1522317 RepID=UPI00058B8A49|nr:4-hydroxy-tetrahydrodipicolinate synthase [Nigerium massiliense]